MYVDSSGREQEDLEMDNMRRDHEDAERAARRVSMPLWEFTHTIRATGYENIALTAQIERATFADALAEFYDECSRTLSYVAPWELAARVRHGDTWSEIRACRECDAGADNDCPDCAGNGYVELARATAR